jgi:hypothetical protein
MISLSGWPDLNWRYRLERVVTRVVATLAYCHTTTYPPDHVNP